MAYPYQTYPSYLPYMQGYNQSAQPMPQMQPVQQPAPVIQQAPQPSIKVRPVASEDEARGVPVEFDGSLMVFPDMGHGMIYSKQFNMQDGSAIFKRYVWEGLIKQQQAEPQPIQEPQTPKVEYVSREEFNALRDELEALKSVPDKAPTNRGGKS